MEPPLILLQPTQVAEVLPHPLEEVAAAPQVVEVAAVQVARAVPAVQVDPAALVVAPPKFLKQVGAVPAAAATASWTAYPVAIKRS